MKAIKPLTIVALGLGGLAAYLLFTRKSTSAIEPPIESGGGTTEEPLSDVELPVVEIPASSGPPPITPFPGDVVPVPMPTKPAGDDPLPMQSVATTTAGKFFKGEGGRWWGQPPYGSYRSIAALNKSHRVVMIANGQGQLLYSEGFWTPYAINTHLVFDKYYPLAAMGDPSVVSAT